MLCMQWTSLICTTLHPKMCCLARCPLSKRKVNMAIYEIGTCVLISKMSPLNSLFVESQQRAYQLSSPATVDTPHLPWLWSQTWGWVRRCRACVSWPGTTTTEWGSWRWVVALQHLPHWWCAHPHSLDTGAMRWGSSVTQRISTHCSMLDHPTQGQGR